MRQTLIAILLLATLGGCASQGRQLSVAPEAQPIDVAAPAAPLTLEEMLEQDGFDLTRALLLFSERYYPEFSGRRHELDIPALTARYEAYTRELERELNRARTPSQRVRTLTDFVHIRLGLRFDPTDQGGTNPENLFFDRMLRNRYGYCVSLSLAYLVFGRGAGMEVQAVRVPGHFAVMVPTRDANGLEAHTILETTDFGSPRDEVHFYTRYRFSMTSVENGVYLTPLTDREIFGTLYNNLAGLTYLRGNARLAIERYTRALELAPLNAEVMYNRAVALRKENRAQEGLRDLNEALRLDPNFALALMLRAGYYWEGGEKQRAREDLAEAMRKRSDWVEPLMLEGKFLLDDKQLDEARGVFQRVLELRPGHKSAHLALAELEHAAGNVNEARRHLREANAE
jgi:regulator of sirC expression with transglutaminase-like and TPR domain